MLGDTSSDERKHKNCAEYHPRADDLLAVHGYNPFRTRRPHHLRENRPARSPDNSHYRHFPHGGPFSSYGGIEPTSDLGSSAYCITAASACHGLF